MLNPFNLQLFPSCYNCLSWSADGELAVAAGEYLYILTPLSAAERTRDDPRAVGGQWRVSRFRVNVFTNSEWPIINPQDRQAFSIGAEQSLSTIVGLSWSPPGLGKHRRCVLGVLTSNLVLSFYEAIGSQGKWARVAIVNGVLGSHFELLDLEEGLMLRKTMIRSFAWCPPLKAPVVGADDSPYSIPDSESRWGIQLLAVTNDDNDVMFLRVQRSQTDASPLSSYALELLTVTSLSDSADNYPMVYPGSVFSTTLNLHIKASSVSCGPWLTAKRQDIGSVTSNAAIIYGSNLKMVRLDVILTHQDQGPGLKSQYRTVASSAENTTISRNLNKCHFQGPFEWLYKDESPDMTLAVGIIAGLAVVSIPIKAYLGGNIGNEKIQTQEWPFHDDISGVQTDKIRHWEPISAMSVDPDGETLCLSTIGGYGATKTFNDLSNGNNFSQPPWKNSFDNYCEQFDIDRDLGGMVIGRIWGLACHAGQLAVAFTMHPKDMVEYRTSVEERTVITFAQLSQQHGEEDNTEVRQETTGHSPESLHVRREAVLGYILHSEQVSDKGNILSPKVVYAAICCAILESENEELLSQARKSLEWLATATGADLSEEISKCVPDSSTIEAKSAEQLTGQGEGEQLFEQCDICDAGIAWYSVQEAQCSNGHLFVRCNLTFLSIQEPGISKFCSGCGTEYLSEEFISSSQDSDLRRTYQTLSDAFDVCIYCGGKFRS